MLVCDATSHDSVKRYVQLLSKLLSKFSWLPDSFVLEFFTENHWEKLPKSWCAIVDNMLDFDELADWLTLTEPMTWKPGKIVWPLSLQALRATVRVYSLPRSPHDDVLPVAKCIDRISHQDVARHSTKLATSRWESVDDQLRPAASLAAHNANCDAIIKSFRRGIKAKKLHEIARLAKVVNMVVERCGAKLAVDVGSGHGHLSRLLTFAYGLRLVSLEADGTHVMDAQRLDNKVVSDMRRRNHRCHGYVSSSSANDHLVENRSSKETTVYSETSIFPRHLVYKIEASVTVKEFIDVLTTACGDDGSSPPTFAQIGLHTCGNLAQTMLRVHSQCAESFAIVSVACCYMKLDDPRSANSCSGQLVAYPMSQFVSSLPDCRLSYEAKELACHAIENYVQRLRNNSKSLKIHCYRATLEALITNRNPLMKRLGLRSVKGSEELSFSEYARQAMQRVSAELLPSSDDLTSDKVDAKISHWKRVIVFYSLRLLLAPIVETLILLDRCLFLWEQGNNPSCIAPLFEPTLSPRNHVLISMKSGKM